MGIISGMTAVLLAAGAVSAQPQDARPAYEAASLKVNASGNRGSSSNGSKSQVMMTNQTLKRLIERAYDVKPFQVTGPVWLEDVRFDIAAKYPADGKRADYPLMLRTLLEDRLKLAVHRESKDMPGYALVVAKSGFKLKPVEPGPSDSHRNGDGHVWTVTMKRAPMEALADTMGSSLGATVIDKTGIPGVYDFDFRWTLEDQNPGSTDADAAAYLFTVLQDTLGKIGLRLQPQKVPVEVVIVDHVERVPIEN
jgi:uncharacterized protein (TIGR03435 family)